MALVDLKSDLSWYSAKGIPRGYRPNADKQSTNFVYNEDLTVSVRPKGYGNDGTAEMYPSITTTNEFQIDNNTKSFRGTARRMNQLGEGSKFPIGPLGQVHKFDLPRLGFNPVTKYEEVYGPLTNSGLADTYTINSPIDDMYNKFKVRDEAFNRGRIREPFILRGIQRDDNSDPQRFIGSDSPADIPRGGILTATERSALDVARISKFLATTAGLNFIAKQSTLALMNPNVEGADGKAQGADGAAKAIHLNSNKLFTPSNTLAEIGSVFTGMHIRKFGLTPVDIQSALIDSPPMAYEEILTETRKPKDQVDKNRLVLIYRDLIRDKDGVTPTKISRKTAIPQLTAGLGPTAISFDGGVGDTTIRRWSVTIPSNQQEIPTGDGQGKAGSIKFEDYQKGRYGYSNDGSKGYIAKLENDISPLEQFIIDDFRGFKSRMLTVITPIVYESVYERTNIGSNIFYDDITKGNELRSTDSPYFAKLVDFRSYANAGGEEIHEAFAPYAKDEDYGNKAGQKGRTEFLPSQLREDADGGKGLRFDGIGISDRAKAENLPAAKDGKNTKVGNLNVLNPISGTPIESKLITTEEEYTALGKIAADRKENSNTDIDFRYDVKEKAKYQEYKKDKTEDQIGITKQVDNFFEDGTTSDLKTFKTQNAPKPAGGSGPDGSELFKYKTLAYDSIQDAAALRKNASPTKILYNRPKSFKTDKFFAEALSEIDGAALDYYEQVEGLNGTDLITFQFNSIRFRAYIDNISDNFSPGFSPEPDQNRADPRYLYTSFERKIQISFKVVYEKSQEDPWSKLKALADLSLPSYGGGPWAQRVDVTIGSLYKSTPMLIESVSYDWDNETPWSLLGDQIDKYNGLPMYTQVQVGLIYMGDVKAAAGSGYVAYG